MRRPPRIVIARRPTSLELVHSCRRNDAASITRAGSRVSGSGSPPSGWPRGFAVTGYVRNLPDGRVELVAEGEPAALDALLEAIRAEMGDKIHSVSSANEPPGDPPFSDFSIR